MFALPVDIVKCSHLPITGAEYNAQQAEVVEKIKNVCSATAILVKEMESIPAQIHALLDVITFFNVNLNKKRRTVGEVAQALSEIASWSLDRNILLLMETTGENCSEALKDVAKTREKAAGYNAAWFQAHPKVAHLKTVDLSNKKLTALPKQIGFFTGLEELNLNNNYIEALPFELADLKKLEALYIANNQLSFLPQFILALPNLLELDAKNNKGVDDYWLKS